MEFEHLHNQQRTEGTEQVPEEQEHQILQESETIRTALGLEVDAEEWKQQLQKVYEEIQYPDPKEGRELIQDDLERRYRILSEQRLNVARMYLAILSLIQQGQPLSEGHQTAVLRNLARYIDNRDIYQHFLEGTVPSGSNLPEYLATYVRTKEEEKLALRTVEMLLPMQYDILEKAGLENESPIKLAPLADQIYLAAIRRKLTMEYVLPALKDGIPVNDEEVIRRFLQGAGYTSILDDDIKAATLALGYIGKHLESIKSYAELSHRELADMTIAESLECCLDLPVMTDIAQEASLQIQALVDGKVPDMRSFMKTLMEQSDLYQQKAVQTALAPLVALNKDSTEEEWEEFQINSKTVLEFVTGFEAKRASVRHADQYLDALDSSKQEHMVREIFRAVQSPEALRALRSSLFISEEEAAHSDVAIALEDLLMKGEITIREAFEIYYLLKASGGQVPLGFKAVSILDDHGQSRLAREAETHLIRRYLDLAASKADMGELLQEYQLSNEQQATVRNMSLYLKEKGVNALEQFWNRLWSWYRYFPEIALPLTLLATGGTGYAVAKGGANLWVKTRMSSLAKFAEETNPDKFAQEHDIPVERVKLAQQQITDILNEYGRLHMRWHMPLKGAKLRNQAVLLHRAAQSTELADMAKALKKRLSGAEEVGRFLAKMSGDNELAVRGALQEAGYLETEIEAVVHEMQSSLHAPDPQSDSKKQTAEILLQELSEEVRQNEEQNPDALKKDLKNLQKESGLQIGEAEASATEKAVEQDQDTAVDPDSDSDSDTDIKGKK